MLEQSLINPNFIGRDGFRWFIGQVVANEISNVDRDVNAKGGIRCKVRILGYHPADNQIKDKNLPWAHVLVPLSLGAGEATNSFTGSISGGEIVFGFFLDGDDGQQPIIIGSLYSGSDIQSVSTWNEVLSRGTSFFKPFSPELKPINIFSKPINAATRGTGGSDRGSPGLGGFCIAPVGVGSARTEDITVGTVLTNSKQNEVIRPISKCESSKGILSGITNLLREFIRIANTVKNTVDVYINPVLNKISDLTGEIKRIADAIVDLLSGLLKKVRDLIINKIHELLKKFIDGLLPAKLKILKEAAANKAADSVWCVIERAIKKLTNFIIEFLTKLVGKVVSIPICAAEQFLGTILDTIINDITSELDSVLKEVTSVLQGTIGTVIGFFDKAINAASSAVAFLSCEDNQCATQYAYELNKGYIPDQDLNFQNIMKYSPSQGIRNLSNDSTIDSFLQNVGIGSGNTNESKINLSCNASVLNCGLPTVSFFGGDGFGATGESVVNSLNEVIGINILKGGAGYTTPPFVSIDDECNNGSGAQAYATVNNGQVTQVVITNPGSGYLGPTTTEDNPCNINPITYSGSEILGTLDDVIVLDPGFGYNNEDLITDSACPGDLELTPIVDDDGRIVDVIINNPGTAIRVFPQLQINTTNGQEAILLPVLKFYSPEDVSYVENNQSKVGKVIYCSEHND